MVYNNFIANALPYRFNTMNGLCSTYDNPDIWFSDTPDTGSGRPSAKLRERMINDALTALSICKNCPMKKPCFDEGMKPENIPHGIWGGTLAGERILVSNIPRNSDMMTKTIPFAKEVRARFSIA